ncbi:MAG: hypothetical protein ACE5I1_06125 [bacterium]
MGQKNMYKKLISFFSLTLILVFALLTPGCQDVQLTGPNKAEQLKDTNQQNEATKSKVRPVSGTVKPLLFKTRNGSTSCLGASTKKFMTVKKGGTLKLCGHTITIPPGALSRDQSIYITIDQNNANIADYGPDQKFNANVTITISYKNAVLDDDDDEDDLTIAWFDKKTGLWMDNGGIVDEENQTVTTTTDHFTQYSLSVR